MTEHAHDRRVTIGVDTHLDVHVAVALDEHGVRLREIHVPTTLAGYREYVAADLRNSPGSISETPQADEPPTGRTSLAA